jgi:cytosine/adenosine deaminase-related metal-dependent hydrolase
MLVNADCGGRTTSVRIQGSRITSLATDPEPGDTIVDLRGDRLLPGLINAHDHLQLNNFPRLKYRDNYANVGEWIADVGEHRQTDPTLRRCEAIPREERLLLGGVKNLLSGVTTVAHHDPQYPSLLEPGFPVRVVMDYGWSHSLPMDGDINVKSSYRQTPLDRPWIIHAAEGLDDAAAAEFERLEALGCIGANTLIVHGVALSASQRQRLMSSSAALIWCPSSNMHLFGHTADVTSLTVRRCVALGSDSRLSGAGDLLDELHIARESSGLDEATLETMVTTDGARLLRQADRGAIAVGSLADLLVLPPKLPLSRATRSDLRMVMLDGSMRYGDPEYGRLLAPPSNWTGVRVDGAAKILERSLALQLAGMQVHEPGLDLVERVSRRA